MKAYKIKLSKKQIEERTVGLDDLKKSLTNEQKQLIETEKKYYRVVMELRKARQAKGLTQEQLAEKARLPRTTITKIESGTYNPTINTLLSVASAMNKKLEIRFV